MDCQLPNVDGYEATRTIRKEGRSSAAPIVALTASVTKEDLERCAAAGMNAHLAKPVDARLLLDTVARYTTRATPTIDVTGALARMGRDRSLLARIAKRFIDDTPRARETLRAAVGRHDANATQFEAHKLRGHAALDAVDAELDRTTDALSMLAK